MNFTRLTLHGLSAIAVYADIVFVRALILSIGFIILTVAGSIVVVGIRLLTDLAIPGWATYVLGILVIIFVQAFALSFSSIFLTLNRKLAPMKSARDAVSRFIQ
jgi:hypothetical protein